MRERGRWGLRDRSPVHGLDRRRLTPVEVFAQSVSGAAPSAAMAATPAIVAASAGDGTVWSFVIAAALALLIAGCIGHFTRRMAAPGGLYSATAKGLGPGAAFASAVALLVGYGLLASGALAGAAIYLDAFLRQTLGLGTGPAVGTVVVVVVGAVVGGLVLRGARLSARVVLLVESVSIGVLVVVFALLLLTGPAPGERAPPSAGGPTGIIAGVLPALAAFIGFEVATSLGAEARRPFKSVPRAVGMTAALTGVFYVYAAQVQVVGFSTTPGGLAGQAEPVVTLARAQGWSWIPAALDIGLFMSFFASSLATATALVRVLFSLSRDGVAPKALGNTHARFRTPHVAIACALPIVVGILAVPIALGVSLGSALVLLLTLATCGFLVAYLLVCAAAPVFLHRIGELTWPPVVASAVIAPILLLVLVAFVVQAPLAAALLTGVVVLGLAWYLWLRLRHGSRLRAMGVYDETTTADVLIEPDRAA